MQLKLTAEERAEFASDIRAELTASNRALVLYEPGDMTHYEFVILRAGHCPAMGVASGDGDCRRNAKPVDWIMADPDHNRARYVAMDTATWPSKLREDWTHNEHEAAVIAELLTMIAEQDPTGIRNDNPSIFGDNV